MRHISVHELHQLDPDDVWHGLLIILAVLVFAVVVVFAARLLVA